MRRPRASSGRGGRRGSRARSPSPAKCRDAVGRGSRVAPFSPFLSTHPSVGGGGAPLSSTAAQQLYTRHRIMAERARRAVGGFLAHKHARAHEHAHTLRRFSSNWVNSNGSPHPTEREKNMASPPLIDVCYFVSFFFYHWILFVLIFPM